MDTQQTNNTNRDIDLLLTSARLSAYLSGACPKIKIDSYRILACGKNLKGHLYIDIYSASDDDTSLMGMEFLISPKMDILQHISYAGGYRPPAKADITPRDIFDNILKPFRTLYLSEGQGTHEIILNGYKCCYIYEPPPDDHEIIKLWNGDAWEIIHEVRFHTHKKYDGGD